MASTQTGPNQLPSFALDAAIGAAFGTSSTRVALPGTPATDAIVVLTNVGTLPVFIALGDSTVVVTVASGVIKAPVVMPGQQRVFALGGATHLAGVVQGAATYYLGSNGILNIETGN